MSVRFTVDLAELDDVIATMASFQDHLDRQLAHLDRTVASLHDTWQGAAADAQRSAHDEWVAGAREMREALTQMRDAARLAHGHYTAAVEANQRMWGGLA